MDSWIMVHRRKVTPRERIEKEINKHDKWCSKECIGFSPSMYRKARLELGLSHEQVKEKREYCHTQN